MNNNFPGRLLLVIVLATSAVSARGETDWSSLDRFQRSITAETFSRLLNDVYSPDGGMIPYLRYAGDQVSIFSTTSQTGAPLIELTFGRTDFSTVAYRGTNAGFRVAIDPGHIGGAWSRMEERFFLVDRERDWPVQEAAINLHVSRLIRDRLAAAGIDAVLVKDDFEPMSSARPDLLMTNPIALPPPDPRFAHLPDVLVESSRHDARRKQIEREFFRTEEIRGRAVVVNETIKPDLTICVHFNATGYGDEKTLYEENGLAFFVHGNYIARELADDEQKFFLLSKLLEQSHDVELHIAASIAEKFAAASGLPPAYNVPPGGVMHPLDTNSYIYARNLAANRQFRGPVIFLEPYFMNNRTVYARIQAGDYDGEREIDGKVYRSIFREYADAVAEGVVAAIAAQLPTSK